MNGPSFRLVALALALAAATPAAAATKLALAPFGAKGAAATKQVEEALCAQVECVDWALVSARGGVKDLAKAKAQGVGGLLVGRTFDLAGKRMLGINLYRGSSAATRSWSFPLGPDGRLKAADLASLKAGVFGLLGGPAPAAAAPPVAKKAAAAPAKAAPTPAPTRAPTPAPAPAKVAPPPRPAVEPLPAAPTPIDAGASPPAPASATPPPAAPPRPIKEAFTWPKVRREAARSSPYLAVELGALVTNRHLSYSGGSGGALQRFDVGLFSSPRGRIEVYPLASGGEMVAGLGLFGDYARSLGFKTMVGTEKADTTFARLHAGLLWSIPLGQSLKLVPALSYETLQLSVSPTVIGMPDAQLAGYRLGLGAELTLHPRFTLLAGGGYLLWSKAQDLVKGSPAFFPGGSAAALEAEAGLAVALVGPLSVRALAEYSRTGYSLDADTTGTYQATKATDAYLGFRLMLRAEF